MPSQIPTILDLSFPRILASAAILGGLMGCQPVVLATTADDDSSGGDTMGEALDGTVGDQNLACAELAQRTSEILANNCSGCHSNPAAQGNFADVTDLQALLSSGKIKPGLPSESLVWQRIDNGSMPPAAIEQRPSLADVETISDWITDCTVQCGEPTFITTEEMIRIMRNDILTVAVEDRPKIRYLTLTHIYNSGLCDSELETYRQALSKVVNSLSQEIIIVPPLAVDPQKTMFRINLEDYGWDASIWRLMVRNNPFAVQYESMDALELQNQAGIAGDPEEVPFQTGDWMISNASRPPLYDAILGVPKFLYEELPPHIAQDIECQLRLEAAGYSFDPVENNGDTLEDMLKIEITKNIEDDKVARAGFIDSGVSVNNRVIERHEFPDTASRAFWISYDFAGNDGDRSVLANPAFIHEAADGSEIIFNLPNGLQAYMIVDKCGIRLDKAPTDIVTDENQLDFAVINGLSCMGCHSEGMKTVQDIVRPWVFGEGFGEFEAPERERIAKLYPTHDVFETILELDIQNFSSALAKAKVRLDLTQEPTIASDKAFQLNLNLQRAAAEFGLQPEQLRTQIGKLGPALQPLLDNTVKRQVFAVDFAQSVCDLNLGNTVKCGLQIPGD